YNGARFLAEAVDSILNQKFPVLEIIVVDDGSTDETADVVATYGRRLRYVRQENLGPAAARNTGIRHSRAAYLAFLDADDLWHEDKLKRQVGRFESIPELELSLTFKRTFWVEEMKDEQERCIRAGHPFTKDHPGYVCQTLLMPRTTFDRVGPFDETLRTGEDTEWLMRAERLGIVKEIIPDVLVYRRMHQNNLSYSRYEGGAEDQLRLVLAHLKQKRSKPA
ncbi:MAG TPA: glycosyltransferase, partial [Rhodothermia bacterium]